MPGVFPLRPLSNSSRHSPPPLRRRMPRGAARPPRFSTPSASRSPARRSRRLAPCSSWLRVERRRRPQVFGTASRGPAATPLSPTAPQRMRSTTTTCVSSRLRTRRRRWCRRRSRPLNWPGNPAAPPSTPTSSDSKSKCLLGRRLQPRHYQRGWHPTSTLGTIGSAAAASRLFGLDAGTTAHALAIAASQASGLKENFGTMIKPLHAGLAAQNGIIAALLAQRGLTGSELAIDGPQGFLSAMDGSHADLGGIGPTWAPAGKFSRPASR